MSERNIMAQDIGNNFKRIRLVAMSALIVALIPCIWGIIYRMAMYAANLTFSDLFHKAASNSRLPVGNWLVSAGLYGSYIGLFMAVIAGATALITLACGIHYKQKRIVLFSIGDILVAVVGLYMSVEIGFVLAGV